MPHVHNALHHFTRQQAAYRAALGEGDPAFQGIERAGETLTPVFNLWDQPEWRILRGEVSYARSVSQAAVAARFSGIEFVNPAGSGFLAVVEMLTLRSGSASFNVTVDSGAALGVNATYGGVARDTRFSQLGEDSICSLVAGDYAGGAALILDVLTSNLQPSWVPYVISPGRKLWIISSAVNTICGGSFMWRERRASDEELARFGV